MFLSLALLMHYVDTIKEVSREGLRLSSNPGVDFLFLLYHVTLYLLVIYVLIPTFFYTKKFGLFFISLFGLLVIYGAIEEGVVEQVLDPEGRGNNSVTWQSIYFFIQENIVPLLAFMSIKFVFDSFEKERKLEQIEKDSLTNELKFLKSQIQPHILFNSLNGLYEYTLAKSDKAPELVLQLSSVLRYVLYETSSTLTSLSKELKFIEDYMALQEMQLEGRGKIQFSVEEERFDESLKIAPFLLIPFIENSFKHSLRSKERDILIIVKIVIQGERISLWVENNFENIATTENLMVKGIGLKNVQKRLALLYPNQHTLQVTQENNLYKVQLDLELA